MTVARDTFRGAEEAINETAKIYLETFRQMYRYLMEL
jgi:hypothetical protein